MWCLESIKLVYLSFESTWLPDWTHPHLRVISATISHHEAYFFMVVEKRETLAWNVNPLGRVYVLHTLNPFVVNIGRHRWKWCALKDKKWLIFQPDPNAFSLITSLRHVILILSTPLRHVILTLSTPLSQVILALLYLIHQRTVSSQWNLST